MTTPTSFERLITALERVTRVERVSATKARCRCPLHDDERASLDLTYRADRRQTWIGCFPCGNRRGLGAEALKRYGIASHEMYDVPAARR